MNPIVELKAQTFARSVELEFRGSTIAIRNGQNVSQATHYVVVREDNRSIVLVVDGEPVTEGQTFSFLSDRELTWSPVEGKTMHFVKE